MSYIGIINIIGFAASISSLLIVFIWGKKKFEAGTRFIIVSLLLMTSFFSMSNFLEWEDYATQLDYVEDYLRVMEPLFWWGIFYTIIMRLQLNREKNIRKELEVALKEARRSKELEIANQHLAKAQSELQQAYREAKANHLKLKDLNIKLHDRNYETLQLNEELQATNEELYNNKNELENALQQIKDTQLHMIQVEKMASIGVLVAGIAHELNNPLNFIHGSILGIEMYMKDNLEDHLHEIAPLIDNINVGTKRASAIIKSLNLFSRQDDEALYNCDIQTIMDNCLVMLNNQTKYKVEIEKQYELKNNLVTGNEGKLHQLFLNILTNAIHAIDDKGKIIIKTSCSNKTVYTSIHDNGRGIKKEYMDKIMDPFFTTKAPGKGTGLGLSLAYNILKQHKGKIAFVSEEGLGTEVKIELPLCTQALTELDQA